MFVQKKNNVWCYKLQMDCIRKYVCHNILKRDWTRVITHHLKHTFDLFFSPFFLQVNEIIIKRIVNFLFRDLMVSQPKKSNSVVIEHVRDMVAQ